MPNKTEEIFKLLGDETRLHILDLLYHGPVCVCQITGVLEEPQAKISRHLAKLRDADLVKTLRKDQFVEYSINDNNIFLMQIMEILQKKHDDPSLEVVRSRQHLKQHYLNQCKI
ncbi:winged helix-turn-helix transcriptional regulator [Clostridia bacterium]|nr:winged helix-turn-helix transcriptional regulator [Clostridia bacterium]